jgi:(p)ppGpp synthase/HD superfamily hydrolase
MSKVDQAEEYARKKHAHAFRKDGKTPYADHLKAVVGNLRRLGVNDEDVLAAGWLHDVIEDTGTDYDDLYEKFGQKTADIVAAVTKDNRLTRHKREQDYLNQLKIAPLEAKLVKLGDILANVKDLENSGYSHEKKLEQIQNKMDYFGVIKPEISQNKSTLSGITIIEAELNNLLKKYEQSSIAF